MADEIRTTIVKTIMGNKRVHFGTATYVDDAVESIISTDLRKVECFIIPQMFVYAAVGGVVTFGHLDPTGNAAVVGWTAIGY